VVHGNNNRTCFDYESYVKSQDTSNSASPNGLQRVLSYVAIHFPLLCGTAYDSPKNL